MNLNEKIITTVQEVVEQWLKENDIPYFIGGSRRFGYHEEGNSDVDIFCFKPEAEFTEEFFSSGLWRHASSDYPVNTQSQIPGIIHFNTMDDKGQFDALELEHQKVELLISKNKIMLNVARAAKTHGCEGSKVFKILLSTSNYMF